MKKIFIRDVCILISVLVGAIFCLGFVMKQEYENHMLEMQVSLENSPVAAGYEQQGFLTFIPFENMEIDVKSADILIQEGDEFSIDYDLHHKEEVKELEVTGGTLRFVTGYCMTPEIGQRDWKVVITVPHDTPMKNLSLSSMAGDIIIQERAFENGTFRSSYGEVQLEDVCCSHLDLKSDLDDIRLVGCEADTVCVETTLGDILLDGTFGEISGDSITGTCTMRGSLTNRATVETLSGNIHVELPEIAIRAETYGKILLNGREGGKLPEPSELSPLLELKSFSGGFDLRTVS